LNRAKGPRGKADALFSKLIRSRGYCQRCGKTRDLQCAHIIGRSYNATRTMEKNAWCLCAGCHLTTTHRREEHFAFIKATIGLDEYWRLYAVAQESIKASDRYWLAECERLNELLNETVE
jgi:hypothetical protein